MNGTLKVLFATLLLAFAGTASAVTYDIQDGNILFIGNLELTFDTEENNGFYNITFVNDTGSNQYGSPPVFDVIPGEEAAIILPQINDAINAAPESVTGASSAGTDQYFIPGVVPQFVPIDVYVAAGGENVLGTWGACQDDCILGVTALGPDEVVTYARIALVPVPAAVWLFGSALGLLGWIRRRTT